MMLKKFRHFENFNSALSFEEPYKGWQKNSFVPKKFLGTLGKKLGSLGTFILPNDFGQIVEVEKCFCRCPLFWVLSQWKREYVGKNKIKSERENMLARTTLEILVNMTGILTLWNQGVKLTSITWSQI